MYRRGSERTCSPGTRARNPVFPETRFDHEFSVRARSGLLLDLVYPFVLLHLSSLTAFLVPHSRDSGGTGAFDIRGVLIPDVFSVLTLKPRISPSSVNDKRGLVHENQSSSGFSMISRNGGRE